MIKLVESKDVCYLNELANYLADGCGDKKRGYIIRRDNSICINNQHNLAYGHDMYTVEGLYNFLIHEACKYTYKLTSSNSELIRNSKINGQGNRLLNNSSNIHKNRQISYHTITFNIGDSVIEYSPVIDEFVIE